MLFPYVAIRHRMGLMQAIVSYIFKKVWCKAPARDYSIELFREFPPLFAIMDQLDRENQAGIDRGVGAFFYSQVNEIYNEFRELSSGEIRKLLHEFRSNNNVRALCEGRLSATRYPKKGQGSRLTEKVRAFFGQLYSSRFFDLKVVTDALGSNLMDHYRSFARSNAVPCCPFCGLQPMDTEHDLTREAYDHYLPASAYPFNSVNLRNLAPACHKCNSQYKLSRDPLLCEAGNARRAFYPYAQSHPAIGISIRFTNLAAVPGDPGDVVITITAPGYEEHIETWNSIYKIKQRYAARSCAPVGGRQWMNRVLDECVNYGKTPREMLHAELLTCDSSPWVDQSFLKAAFLREADRVGLVR